MSWRRSEGEGWNRGGCWRQRQICFWEGERERNEKSVPIIFNKGFNKNTTLFELQTCPILS